MKISKFIFMIISSLVFVVPLYGQTENQLNDMINEGMIYIIKNKQKGIKDGTINPSYFDRFHIFIDNLPLVYEFADEITKSNIPYINSNNLTKNILKKGIWGILLKNVLLKDELITIKFSTIVYRLEKKTRTVAMIDNFTFTYKYFCDEQKWKLINSNP